MDSGPLTRFRFPLRGIASLRPPGRVFDLDLKAVWFVEAMLKLRWWEIGLGLDIVIGWV